MIVMKRQSSLLLLILLCLQLAWADALSDFTSAKAINAPFTSVLIRDLKTGEVLVSHNADKPLIPASIMKSVTTATLLEKIGAKFRYETPVYIEGDKTGTTLKGNVIVIASGDPTLNSGYAPQSADFIAEITDALKKAGIDRIEGSIIVDESNFPGPAVNPGWAAGDLQYAYGTGTHGFNFEDNKNGKNSVKEPVSVFRSKLLKSLAEAGISITNESIGRNGSRKLLFKHQSATIDEIMRSCMMRSDNQFAEAMLRLIGEKYGNEASSSRGAQQMYNHWKEKGANIDNVKIIDGSGLSRTNRVTALFMGDMLTEMWRNPYYASFFPLAGQEGTLRSLLAGTPLEGYIAMKTGSMSGIQCYAGYKLDEDYVPTHLVVFMMNEMGDRSAARKEVEKLLLSTFNQ